MVKEIISLLKQQERRKKVILVSALVFFLVIFPIYSVALIYNEIALTGSPVITKGRILSTRSSAVFFMCASVEYKIDDDDRIGTLCYFPAVEQYKVNQVVKLRYIDQSHRRITFDAPLWKRLVYPGSMFFLALVAIAVLNFLLRRKITVMKIDGQL